VTDLEYKVMMLENAAYRDQLLDGTVLCTIPGVAIIESGIDAEVLYKRGWKLSEVRYALEKRFFG
jgi:hypothetical protein